MSSDKAWGFLNKQSIVKVRVSLEGPQNKQLPIFACRRKRELITLNQELRYRPKPQGRMTFPQNLDKMVLRYMGVSLCCCDRCMSQEFLDHSDVYTVA